jgi:CRISPR/Cas system-associated endonuclease Cas1
MNPYENEASSVPVKKSKHVKYPTAQVIHMPIEKQETKDAVKFVSNKLNNITDFIKEQSTIIS